MSNEKDLKGLSRREFLKSTGVGVAAATAGISLVGTQVAAAQDLNAELAGQKWSFEIPPEPIPDSAIAETVEADVIVVGAGVSGLVAANTAAENGAKVVLFAASSGPAYRGGSFHAVNSKYMEAQGIEPYAVDRFFRRELSNASFNVDQDKWYKFYNNSEEAMNWLIDKMEAAGFETVLEIANVEPNDGPMNVPAQAHGWINEGMRRAGMGAEFVVNTLATTAQASGAEIRYKTIAKQLVREADNTGRVTAIIAENEDGSYTKFVASKGIILATGDFSNNRDMMTKYCPWAVPLLSDAGDLGYDNNFKQGGLFPGDGQKMGLWVGAAWQKTYPNPPMIMGSWIASTQPYGSHRGLVMNKNGYRYGNEDVNGPHAGVNQMHQPDMMAYVIWGANYAEGAAPWYAFGMTRDADPIPPSSILSQWEGQVDEGSLVSGETVEEVIEKLGLPAEATKATIDQYNAYCAAGLDEQYYKRPELLIPIAEAPFYGAVVPPPGFLTVMGGLRTNLDMQVCDETDTPIPGLYNVGVMVGDYYANIYNFLVEGNNLGACCLTFGYTTGRDVALGTV
ncbi:MAG: FAD-dependent oxidoreductase [Anaerolineae bacterium]|nr:FAD-dependent oxidoreductase [Anaerolineae bacterium]